MLCMRSSVPTWAIQWIAETRRAASAARSSNSPDDGLRAGDNAMTLATSEVRDASTPGPGGTRLCLCARRSRRTRVGQQYASGTEVRL